MSGWRPAAKPEDPEVPGLDREFLQLRVAKEWRLSPAEFRQQSADDQALMLAYMMWNDTIEQYRFAYAAEYRELTKDGKDKAAGSFAQMRVAAGLSGPASLQQRIDHKLGLKPK